MRRGLNPPQMLMLSFLVAITLGTILLLLPAATANGSRMKLVDALFTATSATCVTGLIVKDTGTFFSQFGKTVILFLIQLGGLGIMTFSTLFAIILGKKLTIKENIIMQNTLNNYKIQGIAKLIKYIVISTFCLEFVGAGFLYLRWSKVYGSCGQGLLYSSLFHSVSAFCNAGFSLFAENLVNFRADAVVNMVIMVLIVLGGLGFIVLLDIPKMKFWSRNRAYYFSRTSLQTKIVLSMTVFLILLGMCAILFLERNNTQAGMPVKEKLLSACFQSVTARTAGFNTLPIGSLSAPTLFFIIFLMFIGASPGSTGGGIKTTTVAVLLFAWYSALLNKDEISAFGRTVAKQVFDKALMIFLLALVWIFVFTLCLCATERQLAAQPNSFLKIFFEVTSAFGTVGLSTGITPQLSAIGKFLLILTMFVGRVGPLTLVMAVAIRGAKTFYKYPSERVMVG